MESLTELAASAKKHNNVELRSKHSDLLPCEAGVRRQLATFNPLQGTPELDVSFPRIDLDAALQSVKKQKNLPFPVPRFAAFNVLEESLFLTALLDVQDVAEWSRGGASTKRVVQERISHAMTSWPLNGYAGTENAMLKSYRGKKAFWNHLFKSVFTFATIQSWYWMFHCCVDLVSPHDSATLAWIAANILLSIINLIVLCRGDINKPATLTLSTELGDALPENIRNTIKTEKHRFSHMFIVAECNEWSYHTEQHPLPPTIVKGDPLVVGYQNGAYYLVAQFDLTPAEHYLKSEFSA